MCKNIKTATIKVMISSNHRRSVQLQMSVTNRKDSKTFNYHAYITKKFEANSIQTVIDQFSNELVQDWMTLGDHRCYNKLTNNSF